MYHFSIPDSSKMRFINRALFLAMEEHKEWFYSDFVIDLTYGNLPCCIWNGGRADWGQPCDPEEWIKQIVNFNMKFGVKYRLNFTNLCLEPEHLVDVYGNAIATALNKVGGGVTVAMPLMAEYVEKNYPNLDVSWSTTTDYGNEIGEKIRKINILSEKYVVVLPYELNNKEEIFSLKHLNNLELLVNDSCIDNCPLRRKHEYIQSRNIINGIFDVSNNGCLINKEIENGNEKFKKINELATFNSRIARNRLFNFFDKGIYRFKLSGRESSEVALAAYLHYFVQKKHYNDFVSYISGIYSQLVGTYLSIFTNLCNESLLLRILNSLDNGERV